MMTTITRPRTRWSVRVLAPLVLGAVVVLGWHIVSLSGAIAPTILPAPGAVAERFVAELGSGDLLRFAGITVLEALLGCLLAIAVGLPMGYLIARSRIAEAMASPHLAASQAIPAVAIAPLLVIWVGYGLAPIMILCALLVFFPVVLTTVLGLRSIDRDVIEAATLDGASGLALLRFVEWPLALPAVLTGVRNGFTLSVTGAVVGELVMGGHGLGMVLSVQSMSVDTTGLFATLTMLSLIAVLIYLGMLAAEWRLDPLRPVGTARAHAASVGAAASPVTGSGIAGTSRVDTEPPLTTRPVVIAEHCSEPAVARPARLSLVGRAETDRPELVGERHRVESGVA